MLKILCCLFLLCFQLLSYGHGNVRHHYPHSPIYQNGDGIYFDFDRSGIEIYNNYRNSYRPDVYFQYQSNDYWDKGTYSDDPVYSGKHQKFVEPSSAEYPVHEGIVKYQFFVKVISGSAKNKKYRGYFSYDPADVMGFGKEEVPVIDFGFYYEGSEYHEKDLDGVPNLLFYNGRFVRLMLVGGKNGQRFGVNAGFDRDQFNRPSEHFIREGKNFFGYLKNGFVDGAGRIIYRRSVKK